MPPLLTRPEMTRLIQIRDQCANPMRCASCGDSPALTAKLIAKGLVEARGGKVARTGRVMRHADALLTDAGRAVLKGLPDA